MSNDIAEALKYLKQRILGFQASNNVYRIINEEILKYDPSYDDFGVTKLRRNLVIDKSAEIESLRKELAAEKARSAKLVEALKQVDRHWFDGSLRVNKGLACWACMCCDMGDAGRKQNADLHDSDCAITIAHEALAAYSKGEGGVE